MDLWIYQGTRTALVVVFAAFSYLFPTWLRVAYYAILLAWAFLALADGILYMFFALIALSWLGYSLSVWGDGEDKPPWNDWRRKENQRLIMAVLLLGVFGASMGFLGAWRSYV